MQVAFVATIWGLWKECCNRLFKRTELLCKQICSSTQSIFLGKNLKEELIDQVKNIASKWGITILPIEHSCTEVSWHPPLEGWFKSNSDGSLADDRAGYGAIVRNYNGDTIRAMVVQDRLLSSINILEYKAILEGLRICKHLGINSIHLESNSSMAVAWVQGKGCIPWQVLRARNELSTILSSLTQWRITHVFREGNQATDYLASLRTTPGRTSLLSGQFDEPLQHILAKDVAGESYIRSHRR